MSLIRGKAEFWIVASVVAIGTFLRFFQITRESLWLDETYSWLVASKPVLQIFAWMPNDRHPPLYYLTLHFWMYLGDSELVLRSLSAILGILTIVAVYFVAREFFGWKVAAVASLLVAISPVNILYSQETRMYSMLTLLALISIYLLSKAVGDGKKKWWVFYALATTAMIYTHYYGLFVLMAEIVFLFGYIAVKKDINVAVPSMFACAGIMFAYVFWVPTFIHQAVSGVPNWITVNDFLVWVRGFTMLGGDFLPEIRGWHWHDNLFGALLFGLFIYGVFIAWKNRSTGGIILALSVVLTFALSFAISLKKPVYVTRYTVFLAPECIMLLSLALISIWNRLGKYYAIGLVLVLLALNIYQLSVYYPTPIRAQVREASQYIQDNWEKGDIIIFDNPWGATIFNYYGTDSLKQMGLASVDVDENTQRILETNNGIWLALYHNQDYRLMDWFNGLYIRAEDKQLVGVRIIYYDIQ